MSERKTIVKNTTKYYIIIIIYAVLRDKKPFELRAPEKHAKLITKKDA